MRGWIPPRIPAGRSVGERVSRWLPARPRRQRAHTMSPRRRQERRRCRQPLAASRCAPHPGMARHGSARPAALTPGAGSGSRGPALAWGGRLTPSAAAEPPPPPSPSRGAALASNGTGHRRAGAARPGGGGGAGARGWSGVLRARQR